jgi:hypothetical protein
MDGFMVAISIGFSFIPVSGWNKSDGKKHHENSDLFGL